MLVIAGLYFLIALRRNYAHIPAISMDLSTLWVGLFSVVLTTMTVVLGSLIWIVLLKDYPVRVPRRSLFQVYLMAQFAKYIPGNVGHHIGRVVMAKNLGIPVSTTIATMMLEVILGVATAAMLAAVGLAGCDTELFHGFAAKYLWALLIPGAALLVFGTMFAIALINRTCSGLLKRIGLERIPRPGASTLVLAATLFMIIFLLLGFVLKMQAAGLFGVGKASIITITCLFAASWLAGYVVPGAPAGLGVREAVMLALFTPLFGAPVTIGLGVTLRFSTLLGDALAFLLGLCIRSFTPAATRSIRGEP